MLRAKATALGSGSLDSELDDVERIAGIAARAARDELDDLAVDLDVERFCAAPHDLRQLVSRQRLELVDLAPREQRRVDLEVRILGRRPDQRDEAFLDSGQQRVLLRLVEPVDLVEEQDRPLAGAAEAVPRTGENLAHVGHRGRHRGELLEVGTGALGDDPRKRRLPASRRPEEDHRADAILGDREPQRRFLAERLLLAHELVEGARAKPQGERRQLVDPFLGRVGEEVAHVEKYAPAVEGHEAEDFSTPILSGEGESDYERYLRTDELLALQKKPDEQAHRDEHLFQTVHQASELWLKLAWSEAEEATSLLQQNELAAAERLLRRSTLCLQYVIAQLDMLEQMSPWEYQTIRKVLGHGSGFDSPGFREIRRITPQLGQAFFALVRERGLTVVEVYRQGREHEDLYQLAELLIAWDEHISLWRMRHYLVVARVIGDQVVGTQGTPVELLGGLIKQRFYPELWQARNKLTQLSNEED